MPLDGGKKSTAIRFSNHTAKQADSVFRHVEGIIASRKSNTRLDDTDAAWLSGLPDPFYQKLINAGLADARIVARVEAKTEAMELSDFLDDHIQHGRTSQGKPAAITTLANWKSTQRFLNEIFPDRTLASINAEDSHQFRVWMDNRKISQKTHSNHGKPMSENGKRKHIANCKMFFNAAKRRGLILVNPFESQVSSTEANRSRDYYVTSEDTARLLRAAPDAQWRLLIALWRLAGLRKMEVFNLTYKDVLWDDGKLLVRSTKTQHNEGCEIRFTPIRDVRYHLEDARQTAESTAPDSALITRFSRSNSNLDKPFREIIESAGMRPWDKLFQNLRSSCETQWLKEGARADLVANWIGHSVKVQRKNYVQETNDDIENFNAGPSFKSVALGVAEYDGNGQQATESVAADVALGPSKDTETPCFSGSDESNPLPRAGLEPARSYRNPRF